jgi:hydroxymethylpyrimidine/phosphomethylpyrimidine kinase
VGGGDTAQAVNRRPVALTIAGSDSGAGAGVQADLKTFAALGVYGTSAITAVTAQNTVAVRAIHCLPPEIVAAQIDAVFEDFEVGAVKIGMLGAPEIVEVVAAALARWKPPFVVYDPVLAASTGGALAREGFLATLKGGLLDEVDLLTPNLAEAGALLGVAPASNEESMQAQGRALLALGPHAVLMKGGHLEGDAVEWLLAADLEQRFGAPRVAAANTHGTGCTLSSAIAAHRLRGLTLVESVRLAKAFTRDAILAARSERLGRGAGPLMQWPLGPAKT